MMTYTWVLFSKYQQDGSGEKLFIMTCSGCYFQNEQSGVQPAPDSCEQHVIPKLPNRWQQRINIHNDLYLMTYIQVLFPKCTPDGSRGWQITFHYLDSGAIPKMHTRWKQRATKRISWPKPWCYSQNAHQWQQRIAFHVTFTFVILKMHTRWQQRRAFPCLKDSAHLFK